MFACKVMDAIELRLLEQRHAQALLNLTDANRAYLRQWVSFLDATKTVADASAFIDLALRQFAEGRGFHAGIWNYGALCGVIGHIDFDRTNHSTGLGYWLAAACQGRGIMTACCRAVIRHALNELDLHRTVIRCGLDNSRSRAIPERLGFKLEGVARQAQWLYDRYVDHAVYSLLRTDAGATQYLC